MYKYLIIGLLLFVGRTHVTDNSITMKGWANTYPNVGRNMSKIEIYDTKEMAILNKKNGCYSTQFIRIKAQ